MKSVPVEKCCKTNDITGGQWHDESCYSGVILETTERLVIEYANLSGRESANRSEFRVRAQSILSKALQAAVEEERTRIAEAMKRIPIYGSDDYTRGAKEMVELIILAIINKHQ